MKRPAQTDIWVYPAGRPTTSGTTPGTTSTTTTTTTLPPALASARKNLKLTPMRKYEACSMVRQYHRYAKLHNYSLEDKRNYL